VCGLDGSGLGLRRYILPDLLGMTIILPVYLMPVYLQATLTIILLLYSLEIMSYELKYDRFLNANNQKPPNKTTRVQRVCNYRYKNKIQDR